MQHIAEYSEEIRKAVWNTPDMQLLIILKKIRASEKSARTGLEALEFLCFRKDNKDEGQLLI